MSGEYFNLGDYARNISTTSVQAQAWFNRGLNWCYGFNQEEAVRCFQRAIELDPECAMAYWGVAYASGTFYNKPWECFGETEKPKVVKLCFEYAQTALALKDRANELEQQLIEALVLKHPCSRSDVEPEMTQWNIDYANAMRAIYHCFPDDLDVICLTAESLINLTPWKLWNLQYGAPAESAFTEESIAILQHGIDLIENNCLQQHPGIVHFYIHIFEMSPTPEKALPLADELRVLCPDCGHLLHMASHIDALCGQWQEAVTANSRAIEADLKYLRLHGTGEFYMISVLHNYHFKMYAAMFLGQYQAAMSAAQELQALVSDDMLEVEERYLSSTLEAYYSSKIHVLVRFGLWQQITEEPL
ncbi:MAG: tetratricopeptide repeat protein, partial [Gammaproteobacteria bacterium]|nr:tetratricopeptide repeat protein [Gammaproteobacteria bacterium]